MGNNQSADTGITKTSTVIFVEDDFSSRYSLIERIGTGK